MVLLLLSLHLLLHLVIRADVDIHLCLLSRHRLLIPLIGLALGEEGHLRRLALLLILCSFLTAFLLYGAIAAAIVSICVIVFLLENMSHQMVIDFLSVHLDVADRAPLLGLPVGGSILVWTNSQSIHLLR